MKEFNKTDSVEYTRPDYDRAFKRWRVIEDMIYQNHLEKYLRVVEAQLESTDPLRITRNKEYADGAQFAPLLSNALYKVTASAFKKEPETNIPAGLEYLLTNADGGGVGLFQQARKAFFYNISKSRGALYVSVPPEGGDARINLIKAEQVINWTMGMVGDQLKVTMLVIHDKVLVLDGEFAQKDQDRYTVFKNTGVVTSVQYTKNEDSSFNEGEEVTLTDGNGSALDVIPVYFFGAMNNDAEIDEPVMYPVARLNAGHYRNSADIEESSHFAASPMLAVKERVSLETVNEMKQTGFRTGSRTLSMLPIEIVQSDETGLPRTLMQDKEQQIALLLSSMVGTDGEITNKTATQVDSETEDKTNILVMIARNVSAAYIDALKMCLRLNKQADADIEFSINTDFIRPQPDAQLLAQLIAGWMQGGVVTLDSLFKYQKKTGLMSEETTMEEYAESVERTAMPSLGE